MGTKPTNIAMIIGSILGCTVLSTALSSTAYAADPIDKTAAVSQPVDIVVTVIGRAENHPLNVASNVNIIDSEQIEKSGATDLTQVLRGQSGIQISDTGAGAVFSLRGFTASQAANNTLVLIDGRRLNNIDVAAPSLSAIPLNQIERVEVLSGSAGVLYGDQAVGGVINIITKNPENTGGSVQLSAGSFNTAEVKADVAGAINANWHYYLVGSHNQGDNYRDNNANKTGSILGRIQYKTDTDHFFAESSYYDNHRELAGALTIDELEDNPRQAKNDTDYQHEFTTAYRLGYTHQLTDAWSIGADANYTDTLVNRFSWGAPSFNTRSQLTIAPKAVANIATQNGNLHIVSGIDLNRGEAAFSSGRNNTQKTGSAYVHASVPLTDSLSYVVGGRYAKAQDDLTDPNTYSGGVKLDQEAHAFELGLNYRPNLDHRFYLRADDNFRFAKVDEQAYTSPDVMGLKPQTGRSYEAGWDWTPANQRLGIHLYRLNLEDEIVFDSSAETPTGGSFPGANVNADASRRYGANIDWSFNLTEDIELGADYSYIDAKFTEGVNKGKALSWVAKHSGRVFVNYSFATDYRLTTEAAYTGKRFIEGDNANVGEQLDDYLLTNLALNYTHGAWDASVRVDNLFDEQYVAAGYYSSWGNGYYPGTGRSFRATASYRF